MKMVFLRRTGHRSIENGAAIQEQLANWSAAHGWAYSAVYFESFAPLQQVDLMLETDLLVSYHGSGYAAGAESAPRGERQAMRGAP